MNWFRLRFRSGPEERAGQACGRSVERDGYALLHLINMEGRRGLVKLDLSGPEWRDTRRLSLQPEGRELMSDRRGKQVVFTLNSADLDPVHTILRARK